MLDIVADVVPSPLLHMSYVSCLDVESPCFFLLVLAHHCCNLPSIHLFPQNSIVPLCCAKSLLTSYFGCFVDPASVPWNYNVAYQWVFDVVVCCGGHSLLLPHCSNVIFPIRFVVNVVES
jgi:hypothetical protein